MTFSRRSLVWLNVVGGSAVLGSYAFELARHPASRSDLWGGVPDAIVPLYTINMFVAAAGYFAFSTFFYSALAPEPQRAVGAPGPGQLHVLYALVLIPSAAWLPLTFAMLDAPSVPLWWAIRIVLFAVGAGALGLLLTLVRMPARPRRVRRAIAIAGAVPFCLQTAGLDALVWPAFFPF
jgi:hypothetical protein